MEGEKEKVEGFLRFWLGVWGGADRDENRAELQIRVRWTGAQFGA